MKANWVVVGSGGHGREVAAIIQDFLLESGEEVLGFLDDNPALFGSTIAGLPVLGGTEWIAHAGIPLKVAMGLGASQVRFTAVQRIKGLGAEVEFPVVMHPAVHVGPRVILGEGVLIQAGCILTCDVEVGSFAVLNVGVSLSHDSKVGPFTTLAPGSRLAGGAMVGFCAEVGMGTHVIQNRQIGDRTQTGALAAVVRDLPHDVTAVGVPARSLPNR
jgi:sugar O-acyltransferase (sialic acid O-acetyltransferase NeuD family)